VRAWRLDAGWMSTLGRAKVPRGIVYVVDTHGPHAAEQTLVAHILERRPKARLLVVAERLTEERSFPLLRLGVKGLLAYGEAPEQLLEAVKALGSGRYWVPRALLSRFVEKILGDVKHHHRLHAPAELSAREREVLDALLENLSNKEIANKLFISERTAKFHVSNLLAKFGVRRRADLIMLHFQGLSRSS